MKKGLLSIISITLFCPALFISSCKDEDEDIVGDPVPVEINFYVEDAEGNDLLDPDNPSAFKPGSITVTCTEHKGTDKVSYHIGAYDGRRRSGWFDVIVAPFYLDVNLTQKRYLVNIGNYYSAWLASSPDKEVEIEWPDGSKDNIVLKYSESRSKKGLLRQHGYILLNGEKKPWPDHFTIVK